MSKLYRASKDCIGFVEQLGIKLRTTIPNYQRIVLGDMKATHWRDEVQSRVWIKTFMQVHARFNGRDYDTAKVLEGGPQYWITEREIVCLWDLAQLLIDMDSDIYYATNHERPPQATMPRVLETLIERDRIIG